MKGKHVLITGHTGFKGSWLIAMLHHQGAKVSGVALDPVTGGIFEKAALHEFLTHDIRIDIRNSIELKKAFLKISPDVVIHLAAQPLVLASYEKPSETYETNVVGTLNVLQAVYETSSVDVTLIVTTDKVYRQEPGVHKTFVETDALGAADPYSTSKAMADLLTQSWMSSHPDSRIAIARAGNVIGGGDVSQNRIIPDLVRAFSNGETAKVRNPNSVRPWQHVLDCLAGYLVLANSLYNSELSKGAFNFGPANGSAIQVSDLANLASGLWENDANWKADNSGHPDEASFLLLNSAKARDGLGWTDRLIAADSITWAVDWYKREHLGESARALLLEQVSIFESLKSKGGQP